MDPNQRSHQFLNTILYVDNVKFHRGRFDKKSKRQTWNCSYAKKTRCNCRAITQLVEINCDFREQLLSLDTSDESVSETIDPRTKTDQYSEKLVSASDSKDHLNFHDVDPYSFLVDQFHHELNSIIQAQPTRDPKELLDLTRQRFTEAMTTEDRELFGVALNHHSISKT